MDENELAALIAAQGRTMESALATMQGRLNGIETAANRRSFAGPAGGGVDPEESARRWFAAAKERDPGAGGFSAEDYQEYRSAFETYIRKSDRGLGEAARNAMSVGSDPEGGYFVPDEVSAVIRRREFETSPMRAIADVTTIGSDALSVPIDADDATSGGWRGETQSRDATATPAVKMQRIGVHEQYANPEVSQSLLDDAFINVEEWLGNKIADKMGRTENVTFVTGTGVQKPRGFLDYGTAAVTTDDASRTWGVLQYVPVGASGAFPTAGSPTYDDGDALLTLVYKLKAAYRMNARWVMNKATAGVVRKLKDADGRHLWTNGRMDEGQPDRLHGYPVAELEDMPDISADSFSIAFGDFRRGYLIVDRAGIRMLRDPYTNKPFVGFYTTKRVGGDVVDSDAIKLLKFSES